MEFWLHILSTEAWLDHMFMDRGIVGDRQHVIANEVRRAFGLPRLRWNQPWWVL